MVHRMTNDLMMYFNVTAHSRISVVIEVHNIPGPVDWILMNDIKLQQHISFNSIRTPGTYHYDTMTNNIYIHPLYTSLGISLTVCMH